MFVLQTSICESLSLCYIVLHERGWGGGGGGLSGPVSPLCYVLLRSSCHLAVMMPVVSWCFRGLPDCLTMPVGVAEVYLTVSPCQLVLQRSTCLTMPDGVAEVY